MTGNRAAVWSVVLSPGAQTFKNKPFVASEGYVRGGNYRFPGNCVPNASNNNTCCWQDAASGGQTCLNFYGGCNGAYRQCGYNESFQCNTVTVNTNYPVTGWVKSSQTGSGLIANGDFSSQLSNWQCAGAISGDCSADAGTYTSGPYSARVTNTGGGWGWQVGQSGISASPGQQFCLSARVAKNNANDTAGVALQEGGSPWREDDILASNQTGWQTLRKTVTVGSDWTLPVGVFARVWNSGGQAWFDDISLFNGPCQSGIPNVEIQVYDDTFGKQTRKTTTDVNGYWAINNFVRPGDFYAVRVTDNLLNPKTAPAGYVPPAKTSELGWNWNFNINPNPGTNPWADTPLGSPSYEGQKAGSGADCEAKNGAGVDDRCSFSYDSFPAPTASITGPLTGFVDQPLTYSAQIFNAGSGDIYVTREDGNPFTCPTQLQGRWCWMGQVTNVINNGTGFDGKFTPREAGRYIVVVSAYSNPTAAYTGSPYTECSGNPVTFNPAAWSDCGPNDNILTVVDTVPAPGPSAWIQTFGGDVHSNTRINTPGGPGMLIFLQRSFLSKIHYIGLWAWLKAYQPQSVYRIFHTYHRLHF